MQQVSAYDHGRCIAMAGAAGDQALALVVSDPMEEAEVEFKPLLEDVR